MSHILTVYDQLHLYACQDSLLMAFPLSLLQSQIFSISSTVHFNLHSHGRAVADLLHRTFTTVADQQQTGKVIPDPFEDEPTLTDICSPIPSIPRRAYFL